MIMSKQIVTNDKGGANNAHIPTNVHNYDFNELTTRTHRSRPRGVSASSSRRRPKAGMSPGHAARNIAV